MSLKVNYTLDLIKEVPILFFCVCRSILGKSMLRDIFLWKLTLWLFFFSVRSYLAELSNLDSPFKILFSFLLMQKNPEQNKTGVHEHSAPLFSSLIKPAVKFHSVCGVEWKTFCTKIIHIHFHSLPYCKCLGKKRQWHLERSKSRF